MLVKQGYLIDPETSTLERCVNVIITYELMTNNNGCNYNQLSSVVLIGRKKKFFESSSIVIGTNVYCEPVCTTVVCSPTTAPDQIVCSRSTHGCNEFTTVIPSIQGGEVILNAFIKNQLPNQCKIFGLPGSSIFQWDKILQNAIEAGKLDHVHITNEIAGTYEAQNFSDVKEGGKKVGVSFSTRGPGICMGVTGIASAFREELPLIYVSGVSPTDRQDEFQNVDLKLLSNITKKVFRITRAIKCIDELEAVIDEACFTAINGTCQNPGRGLVALLVDLDVWRNPMGISCSYKFIPKPVLTGNEDNALYDIITRWNNPSVKAIVVRVGTRVFSEKAQLIIDLAKLFPQMYVVTVADSRGLISPTVNTGATKKYLDLQGPVGVATANAATDYASKNGIVLDLGVGVLYTTLVTDVIASGTGSVLRLFDEPIEFDGHLVNVNYVIQQLWNNKSKLKVGGIPTFSPSSPYSGLTPNTNLIYLGLPFGGDTTKAFKAIIDTYLNQTNLSGRLYPMPGPSLGCWVAKCITNFYALPITDPNCDYTINVDYNFVCDSGTATFIAGVLMRNNIPDNDCIYTEFSAIGLGIASAAGKLWRNEKDAVLFVGDGGTMNLLGHLIDLKQAAVSNNRRALFLYFNDFKYGNVALGDLALFSNWTSITSTTDLMSTFNVDTYFSSLSPVKQLTATFGTIDGYMQSFRTGAAGWTAPGLYIIRMDGNTTKILNTNGIDYLIPQF